MKKICFAIAIMLFGFIVAYSLNEPFYSSLFGIIGLVFAIIGLVEKDGK